MNSREYEELEAIRKNLKIKRDRIDELDDEIKECRQKEHEKIDPMKTELQEKFDKDYDNMDLRAEHGITNQTKWKKELDKKYAPVQEKIDNISVGFEIERETRYNEIRELKKEIKDLELEHINKHAYYSQVETQKVSIDFNMINKAIEESSSK